jgi:RNA polymerase sigma-70 factor (ECF subfamily)
MKDNYFEQVYEKTHRSLIRYAIVHLDDPTDAEDALQNVYVDFYRRIQQYGHFDILSPEAFLIKMLKREIIQNYKERERRRLRFVEEIKEDRIPEEPFEDVVMDRALAEEIFRNAKALPKEMYRTFVLYYGYEMSVSEIASQLDVSKEAVKSRLLRARNILKQRMGETCSNGGITHE